MANETTETTLEDLYSFDETNGTIDAADYSVVESIVKSDVTTALEVEGEVEMATPLGRLLEWLSLYFTRVLGLNVQNANQLLISAAAGQQLDAMAQWFQLSRKASSYSTVTVTCYGTANAEQEVTIPAGSTVRNTSGNVFESLSNATIPAATAENPIPSVPVEFEAIDKGPVDVSAGSVNILDTAIYGWESCNNQNDGTSGAELETDESLRDRILSARETAPGFLGAMKNAIEKVVGSGSAVVIENNTGANLAVHGIDMDPHSILACVDGLKNPSVPGYAEDEKVQAVAKAIFDTKPCGTGYTVPSSSPSADTVQNTDGTTSSTVTSEYQYDVPIKDPFGNEYHVFFYAPTEQPVNVSLQVQKRNYTGTDVFSDVRAAVREWANESHFKCGESIYSSSIIKAVEEKVPGIIVIDCTVSDGGTDKGTSFVEINAIHRAKIQDIKPSLYSK